MHFADRTLARLADPASRGELFTPLLAERLLGAAFGTSGALTAPFSANVDRLSLGVSAGLEPQLRARLRPPDGRAGWELEASAAGLDANAPVLPAVVEGFASATVPPVTGRVSRVVSHADTFPDVATLETGATPAERADAARFERRRRIALAHHVADPALSDDDASRLTQQWLAAAGVARVADLVAVADGPHGVARLALTFELLEPGPPAVRTARFVAGVVVDTLEGDGPSLLGMLQRTRELQKVVAAAGRRTAPLGGLEPTCPAPVIWFVPVTVFEDEDWPLAAGGFVADPSAAREAQAAAWLAEQGIVLAGVP